MTVVERFRTCRCVQCGEAKTVRAVCELELVPLMLPGGWCKLTRPGVIPGDYCGDCAKRVLSFAKDSTS